MIRSDHRIVVRPRLPVGAVDEAQRAADERGVPLADFLGDVVAGQLPETLAELAREKLDRMGRLAAEHTAAHGCPVEPTSANGSAPVVHRGTLNDFLQTSSSSSIQLDVPMKGSSSDGTLT